MAELKITVQRSGGSGGGSNGGGAFTPQDAQAIVRALDQANRLSTVLLKGARDFRQEFSAAATGLQTGLNAAATNADRNASRMALGFQRSLEQAATAGGKAFERETQRGVSRGLSNALGALTGTIAAGSRVAFPAFSRFGAESASAFGVAFSGGVGNLVRGGAGLGGATARLGGELGRALSTSAGAAFKLIPAIGPALGGVAGAIGGAFSIAGSLAGTLASAAGEVAGAFGDSLTTALKVTVGAAVVTGVAGLRLALKADALEPAFERFAKTSGEDIPRALDRLRRATGGTVSDLDLMRSANEAVQLGAARTVTEFATLANGAIRLGQAVGRDANQSVGDLVVGLGRMSPRILDNIGLQVSLEKATEAAAAATGRNADQLSDAEKRAAFFDAALQQVREKLAGLPEIGDRASSRFGAFGVAVENAGLQIGRTLLPALDRLATPVTRVTNAITGFVARLGDINGEGFRDFYAAFDAGAARVTAFFERASAQDIFALSRDGAGLFFDYVDQRATIFGRRLKLEIAEALGDAALAGRNAIGSAASFGGLLPNRNEERTTEAQRNAAAIRRAGENSIRLLTEQADTNFASGAANLGLRANLVANRPREATGFGAGNQSAFGINAALAASLGSTTGTITTGAVAASRPALARNDQIPDRGAPQSVAVPSFSLQPNANILAQSLAASGSSASAVASVIPALETIGAALTAAGKSADEVSAAAEAFAARNIADVADSYGEALTAPLERSIANFEENAREVDRLADREQDAIAKAREAMERLGEDLADGLDDIADAFSRDRDAVLARRDQRIAAANQRTASLRDQLIGQAGGIGPDESAIPPKLRRAASKARRQANRERRDSLRQLSDGLSTDELAANGAALLQNVFEEQASRETNRSGEIQAAYASAAAAIRELENERIAAETALRETITAEAEKQQELLRKSIDILEGLSKSKEADIRALEELKNRLAVVEATLKKTEDLARRAAR